MKWKANYTPFVCMSLLLFCSAQVTLARNPISWVSDKITGTQEQYQLHKLKSKLIMSHPDTPPRKRVPGLVHELIDRANIWQNIGMGMPVDMALRAAPQEVASSMCKELTLRAGVAKIPGMQEAGRVHPGRAEILKSSVDFSFDVAEKLHSVPRGHKKAELLPIGVRHFIASPLTKMLGSVLTKAGFAIPAWGPLSLMVQIAFGYDLGDWISTYTKNIIMGLWSSKRIIPRLSLFKEAMPPSGLLQIIKGSLQDVNGRKNLTVMQE